MKNYLQLMRFKHYIKNFLIFLPLVFGGKLFNIDLLLNNLLGFISFCFLASVIYIINDIADVKQDQLHPIKCKRPIASGKIEKKNAIIFAISLFILSLIFNIILFIKADYLVLILWSIYFLINLAYSFGLKKIPVIDVVILASGFLIRVLYGGAISQIGVSIWLCSSVLMLSFYMGLGKRRNELKNQGECVRKVLKYYNYKVINVVMYIFFVLTLVSYTLWCVTVASIGKFSIGIYFTIPIVFLIIARYSNDIEGKVDGDPINVILKDKYIYLGGISYILILFLILYENVLIK